MEFQSDLSSLQPQHPCLSQGDSSSQTLMEPRVSLPNPSAAVHSSEQGGWRPQGCAARKGLAGWADPRFQGHPGWSVIHSPAVPCDSRLALELEGQLSESVFLCVFACLFVCLCMCVLCVHVSVCVLCSLCMSACPSTWVYVCVFVCMNPVQ